MGLAKMEELVDTAKAKESLQRVAAAVFRATPKPFESVRVNYRAVGGMATYDFMLTEKAGDAERPVDLRSDDDFTFGFRNLRKAMYQEGKGAWYTADVTVTGQGKFHAEYDYDGKPRFSVPLASATYVEDLERFPRDVENQPQWLREELSAADS